MVTGERGLNIIKKYEKLKLRAYKCPAGVLTIGYGHTGNVKPGDVITVAVAVSLLKNDVKNAENAVNSLNKKLTQCQYDALVSFIFNCGIGSFNASTLRKKVKANPTDLSIANEFKKWIYARGDNNGIDDDGDGITDEPGEKQALPGLIKRRAEEAALYFDVECE